MATANPNIQHGNSTATNPGNSTTAGQHSSHEAGSPLTERATKSLHEAIDNLAARVSATEMSLRDGANSSAEAISAKQAEMMRKWEGSNVRKYAATHPVAAAGIAFAGGLLVASLLSKSTNNKPE